MFENFLVSFLFSFVLNVYDITFKDYKNQTGIQLSKQKQM